MFMKRKLADIFQNANLNTIVSSGLILKGTLPPGRNACQESTWSNHVHTALMKTCSPTRGTMLSGQMKNDKSHSSTV